MTNIAIMDIYRFSKNAFTAHMPDIFK